MRRAAFTMVELLVALAVLAVLAGVAVPVTMQQLGKAKRQSTRSEMDHVAEAIRAYAADRGYDPKSPRWGRFPPEVKGKGKYATILGPDLEVDASGAGWHPVLRKGWNGPYITSERTRTDADGKGAALDVAAYQVDGWGRYYIYRNRNGSGSAVKKSDAERVVTLTSGGPDRDPSTAADNVVLTIYRGPIY